MKYFILFAVVFSFTSAFSQKRKAEVLTVKLVGVEKPLTIVIKGEVLEPDTYDEYVKTKN